MPNSVPVRFATFNASLTRSNPEDLITDLSTGEGTDTIGDFEIDADLIGLADELSLGQLTQTIQRNTLLLAVADKTLALVQRVTTLTAESFIQI